MDLDMGFQNLALVKLLRGSLVFNFKFVPVFSAWNNILVIYKLPTALCGLVSDLHGLHVDVLDPGSTGEISVITITT
jgi:TRAP-type uncharacterized transport system substrate-binding protein